MRVTQLLLLVLFITLPFIHGKIFPTLNINFFYELSGNFEFSKSICFNIFTCFILSSFIIESLYKKKQIHIPKILYVILGIVWLSTFFSPSTFTSLIWDTQKGHTALFSLNLIWILIVLINQKKWFFLHLTYASLITCIFVCILALKEYFLPSYDYWNLSTRAFWSFGHPNYLAAYILVLIPLIELVKNKFLKYIFLWIYLTTLIITQSLTGIFLAFWYLFFKYLPHKLKNNLTLIGWGVLLIMIIIFIWKYFPEKLHSFVSRFYIWETTLRIIFSDIRIFIFGWWLETLPYYFDSFKVPEVYIFENFGFTADRPHNFLLNIFYHFWILWLWVAIYLVIHFLQSFKVNFHPVKISIVLFLLFWVFQFFSISVYLIVLLLIAVIYNDTKERDRKNNTDYTSYSIVVWIAILSIFWGYNSFKLYSAEILYANKNYNIANETFSHPDYLVELWDYSEAKIREWIYSQKNLRYSVILWKDIVSWCKKLVSSYPSAENYFYCGKVLEGFEKGDEAMSYYINWLEKMPDLWNDDSKYWDRYFIKHTITGNRFFSEKFSDISEILKKTHNQ